MTVTGTSGTSAVLTNTSASTSPLSANKGLGQDAFMKLLITQLTHQDPTKPQDDTAFIAQLAQFSQLEKLTEIATSIKALEQLVAGGATAAPTTTQAQTTSGTGPTGGK